MKIEELRIADDCKYAIIIEDLDGITKASDIMRLRRMLEAWWRSRDKFIIITQFGNIEAKFVRIDKEES